MKKYLLPILLAGALFVQAQSSLYFASQPVLTPDAKEIYFCYDKGIWKVPVTGGAAVRVTANTGYQSNPILSPDGKWLAFTSDELGNNNIYVTPVEGGNIRQLTFHEASDISRSWSADSEYIYFESNRYNQTTTFRLSIHGGTPERLFAGYFNNITFLVENPANGTYYFNNSSEAYNYPTRKGYKGANNPDIQSWNPKRKEYRQVTTYPGKDIWPSTDGKGNLYWASDEKNGEYNITCLKDGNPHTLTNYTTAVHQPVVSHNGEKIVFVKDYTIHLYDVQTGKTTIPPIKAYENNQPGIDIPYSISGKITHFDISPDGKKMAFVSRGRLFVSDTKGLFIQPIHTNPEERVTEVKWSKDNTSIYYLRTRNGWYNLYKITASGAAAERAIYTPDKMVKNLKMSNDRSQIAFNTGNDWVELLRCDNDKVEKLSENEFWSFRNYSMSFSPDGSYLAFTAMNLFESDIFVCNLKTKEVINLTNSASVENSPAWSADGKYLYLTANRYSSSFPRGSNSSLYRIRLGYTDKPYKTKEYRGLFSNDTMKVAPKISINTDKIQRRWETVRGEGAQSAVMTLTNSKKNYLLYSSNHEGIRGVYVQELKDFDQKPAKKIPNVTSLTAAGDKELYMLSGGDIYSVNLPGASSEKIELKYEFSQNNRNEFNQMFHEVWASITENFYDPHFHGIDWNAKRSYYARFLPYLKSRRDLRTLINDMLGELNSSHLGFVSSGPEERKETTMRTIETGIVFDNENPYKVAGIIRGTPAYVAENGLKVEAGDVLAAVNGRKVDEKVNREYYFASPLSGQEVTLTFKRGTKSFDMMLHTIPALSVSSLNYTRWEDECRERVARKTNGRVAYHHMRDMSTNALNSFLIDMQTDAVHKDALILDLRYNNGGNVHDEVLEYLSRRKHFTWSFRDKQQNTHPNVTPGDKPVIVLINEQSLSDAEVTSNGIQTLGIGKLVGTETYRWIIFTTGTQLVDGSFCRLPAWGCYNLKGEDMEFVGVSPDIYVKNTFSDRLNGDDPQLDRAIQEVLKELGR